MIKKISLFILLGLFYSFGIYAQTNEIPRDWHMLDFNKDSVYGISAEKAYSEILKNSVSKNVIVAIIDSGADTLQEDIKGKIWRNPKEIYGDHKDNDKDGYIDDYYGWNFLGGKSVADNVTKDSYVVDRVYFAYKSKFENIQNIKEVAPKDLSNYKLWTKAKEILTQKANQNKDAENVSEASQILTKLSDFKKFMLKDTFTLKDVEAYDPIDDKSRAEKDFYSSIFGWFPEGTNNVELPNKMNLLIDSLQKANAIPSNAPIPYRANVVKDDYSSIKDKFYGNSNISAGNVMHGTHVSGIIGADRHNKLGINGIADNVSLMEIRAVPDGDEHDKDIALAIYFAVDHGAKVINMSFGKPLSPNRAWVEEAIKYAEKKDVLIVHAAGNDGQDLDSITNYPTQFYGPNDSKSFKNMITVGANGPTADQLVAYFSNFGNRSVDVFAPGVNIYSTLPGKSNYGSLSGTSMAAPVVSGVAAVIRSSFPKLTAPQVKQIIMQSVTKIEFPVMNPASGKDVVMNSLCASGGIVNLYNALLLAKKMSSN